MIEPKNEARAFEADNATAIRNRELPEPAGSPELLGFSIVSPIPVGAVGLKGLGAIRP
jgi:hypothetical protein